MAAQPLQVVAGNTNILFEVNCTTMHDQQKWYEEMQDGTSNTSSVKKCLLRTNCNVGSGYPEISDGSLGALNGFHWTYHST
jgi:hypothetical protein